MVREKMSKTYLIRFTDEEREFVRRMSWERKQKISDYFRGLLKADMKRENERFQKHKAAANLFKKV